MKIETSGSHKRIENLEVKVTRLEKLLRAQKESNRERDERVGRAISRLKKALPHVNFEDPE